MKEPLLTQDETEVQRFILSSSYARFAFYLNESNKINLSWEYDQRLHLKIEAR